MDKERMKRTPRLRKETIRKLDLRTLAPGDLANVVGGHTRKPVFTCGCQGCD